MEQDADKKLNYVISQLKRTQVTQPDAFVEWMRQNQDKVEVLFSVVDVLRSEGVTFEDIVKQIEFGNEFRALLEFQLEFAKLHDIDSLAAEPGTFIFDRQMIPTFERNYRKLPQPSSTVPTNISFGMILIPLQTIRIINNGTPDYFFGTGEDTRLEVTQTEYGPQFSMYIHAKAYRLLGNNVVILGMNQLTTLIQRRLLILTYAKQGDDVILHSQEADIDVSNVAVNLRLSSNNMSIPVEEFKVFINDLPRGVRLVQNLISTNNADGFDMFKQIYIATLIQELVPQITSYFQSTYGDNLTTSLFGQGAAVSISQLYNLAQATLRREEVNYSYDAGNRIITPTPYVVPITNTVPFIHNIPIDSNQVYGCSRAPGSAGFHTNAWNSTNFPITMAGVRINNQQAFLTDELNIIRTTTTKIPITQQTSNTTSTAEAWIEQRITSVSNVSFLRQQVQVISLPSGVPLDPGLYKINMIAGGNINSQQNGVAEIYGIQLLARPTDSTTSFRLSIKRDYSSTSTRNTYMVIKPDNLASDSTNPLRAKVKYIEGTTNREVNTNMTPQRIEYANSSANAYVGLLSTTSGQYNFSIVSSVTFEGSMPNTTGIQFTGNNLETSIQSSSRSSFRIRVPIAPIGLAERRVAGVWTGISRVPGQVLDNDPTQRQGPYIIFSPPHCWQAWYDGFNDNYISCYLSIDPAFPSQAISPLYMENNQVRFQEITTGTQLSAAVDMYGYDLSLQRIRETSVPLIRTSSISGSFSPILGWHSEFIGTSPQITFQSFEGDVIELVLPDGIYNQYVLSESILNLQSGIAFLNEYAGYLEYLINHLEERVSIVERTMQEVISTLDAIINAISPQQSSIGAQILGFLGPSVGMFFPLTGLALSITGNIFNGVSQIQDGNLLTGMLDITTGALMSVLGVRKFKQRMDRKYGNTPTTDPPPYPSVLPSYDELYGRPGLNSVGTNPLPTTSSTVRTSSGVLKNSNIIYDDKKTIVETLLLQQGLSAAYAFNRPVTFSTSVYKEKVLAGKVIEIWNDAKIRVSTSLGLYELEYGKDADILEREISQSEFEMIFRTQLSKDEYIKWLYTYGHLGQQVSDTLGLDDEVFKLMAITNLTPTSNAQSVIKGNLQRIVKYTDNLQDGTEKPLDPTINRSPMSVTQISEVLNPFQATSSLTIRLFDNMYDFVDSRF